MKLFGSSEAPVSPHFEEIVQARCVVRLANLVGFIQAPSSPNSVDEIEVDVTELPQLIEDVEAVRQEFAASPDDMQLALQRNEPQLIQGAQEELPQAF